jgi:phytoene dehydrogenase-like protein
MAVFTPVGPAAPSAVTISAKGKPTISAVTTSVTPGTEVQVVIPAGTKAFSLKAKSDSGIAAKLLVATTSGLTATDNRFDIMPGNIWREDLLTGSSAFDLYIASTKASTVIQLILWS